MIYSHLRFIRLGMTFQSTPITEKKVQHPLNISVLAQIEQITSLNAPVYYSTTCYLANSSRQVNHSIICRF